MRFFRQTWTLAENDLLIVVRRHWLSTFIRALAFPIVLTVILAEVEHWLGSSGYWGVGSPSPILSLSDALNAAGSSRPNVVIVNNGLHGGDVGAVVDSLSSTVQGSGKNLFVVEDASSLSSLCPSSNSGISPCYAAVEINSSPTQGNGGIWNYTIFSDRALGGSVYVDRTDNAPQIYLFPLQNAVNSAIASTNGSRLPDNIQQYPYTSQSEAQREAENRLIYFEYIQAFLAFVLFIGLAGSTFHLVGWVTVQRENGLLQLIDAMMPTSSRWQCLAARILANHFVFDLIYLPSWIVMGVSLSRIAFPLTNTGVFVLLYVLTGLALNSYSILASSLFKKAQLSAISSIVLVIVLAIAAQFGEGITVELASSPGVIATSVLFAPMNFVYTLMVIATFESQGQPFDFNTSPKSSFSGEISWDVPGSTLIGLLVFQILVYPVLGAIIERYLHGTSSKGHHVHEDGQSLEGNAVRLRNFSKLYKASSKKKVVKAVDDLSFDLVSGSITVLLGANGSGKSTTLNAISGLETITSGSIELDGTGGMGLCPQKNVMWDELTVYEHVDFFERLKSTSPLTKSSRKAEVEGIISSCDLALKSNAKSKTLSGGQKRKLQMAMMLAGGSKVCCVDEGSSGIDPVARRKLWDIMLAERGSRSILLTTHFLDEAEVLSDHVVILSKGQLKAQGTAAALMNQLGGGYQVILDDHSTAAMVDASYQTNMKLDYDRPIYEFADQTSLAGFAASLEASGIPDYHIQGPTIEKVFLKLADEMHDDSDLNPETFPLKIEGSPQGSLDSPAPTSDPGKGLSLYAGKGSGPFRQTWVLFCKRFTILRHTFMPYVTALFISLTLAGLVTRFFINFDYANGIGCHSGDSSSADEQTYPEQLSAPDFANRGFVYGPSSMISTSELTRLIPNPGGLYGSRPEPFNFSRAPTVDSMQAFTSYIVQHTESLDVGGFYDSSNAPVFAWQADASEPGFPSFLQSVVDGVLINQTIAFSYQNFAATFSPSNGVTTLVAVLTTLGFAIYPGLFALYPTAERLRNVRAMHYSNGIRSSSIWMAYSLFDLIFVLLISVLTVVIWTTQWHGWYGLGYMFVVFFLYGLAATAYSYVMSLFAKSQLAAIALTSVTQVVISMLFLVGCVLAEIYAPGPDVYHWFNYMYYTIALISPAVSLLRALYMTLNMWSLDCRGDNLASYPGEISIYGGPILYLTLQFVFLCAFMVFWESGKSLEVFGIRRKTKTPDREAAIRSQEADAQEDPDRLSPSNDGLRVLSTSKAFGANQAVEDVSFGVRGSEKFALLGPNGAGKSTMISLIRGDLKPTGGAGDIYIGGDSLHAAPLAAKNHLGVCPQFDSTDSMTLAEHLHFYARARNVPHREHNVATLIRRLGLAPHAHKLARKLSGGTQRKLSLAIALIANPRVLLLDEPSSGMDPAAKRALWRTLRAVAADRVLLITTHSMEEADALCDRAAIMAGRLLALGNIADLRARHGGALYAHVALAGAPYSSAEAVAAVRDWVLDKFAGAQVEARTFHGQVRFCVPERGAAPRGYTMGEMLGVIERAKGELGIEHYSIGPATLDQVFMNVVTRHNVEEENSGRGEQKARGLRGLLKR